MCPHSTLLCVIGNITAKHLKIYGGIKMAEKVEIMLGPDHWEERTTQNIAEWELLLPMRCCGRDKQGHVCHAIMTHATCRRTGKVKEFRQKGDEIPHIFGCQFDERPQYRRIVNPDYRAKGYSSEDIWNSISNSKKHKGVPGGGGGTPPTRGPEEPGQKKEPSEKPIKTTVALPRNILQYFDVLQALNINNQYADSHVRDLIIDSRTVQYHRENGPPVGTPILILAKKLHPDYCPLKRNPDEVILIDVGYSAAAKKDPDGCLLFRLQLRGESKKVLQNFLSSKQKDTYLLLFGRLAKDSFHPDSYFVNHLDSHRIGIIRLAKQ